jgi:transcriptional regulator with XRE-family HTH domain
MTGTDFYTWRAAHGLKQHELAAILHCSQSLISRWEHGRDPVPRLVELLLAMEYVHPKAWRWLCQAQDR